MSKQTESADTKPPQPTEKSEVGPSMLGSDVLVACLEREGVDTIFAYPGGASMEFHQALTKSSQIRTILPRHEQGGVFAAEGYARATGKVGVCMATSGPGATNLITGIADAFMDSIPIVAVTGQVPQAMIGKGAFQETDVFGLTLPIIKHSYLVTDLTELPRIVKEAFYIARTGRPGPVLVDVPKNIQQQRIQPVFPTEVDIRSYRPHSKAPDLPLNEIIGLIEKSEKPVLYIGGGIISADAHLELREFVDKTKIPVTSTIMGCGAFPETHPLSLKWLGMHGTAYANWAVAEADLLLALGVRFDDRVTGKVEKFCEHGTIVHIDIDPSEINKNKPANLPIISDVKYALTKLNELLSVRKISADFTPWHEKIDGWKKKAPLKYKVSEEHLTSSHVKEHHLDSHDEIIIPQHAIELIYELTQGEAIITTGVGQHQMWAGQYYKFDEPRRFLTSAGLGSMGFGYPAAIGAKTACPDRQVIDIDGDGSFIMNIQELATAHIERIGAKAVILNNQHLGMVVQWEDRFYAGNRGHTYLGDPEKASNIYPDYVAMAQSFNVPCERVLFKKDLRAAIERMLESEGPYVLDVIVPYTEHVLPFIKAGGTIDDMIYE